MPRQSWEQRRLKTLANRRAWNLAQLRKVADRLELLEQAAAANVVARETFKTRKGSQHQPQA